MRKTVGVLAAITLCAFAAGAAVDIAQGLGAGYVDTENGQFLPGIKPTVTVSVPKPLLRLATVASGSVAPEVGELLGSVNHVQVKVFDKIENGDEARAAAAKFVAALQQDAWHPMVEVDEGNEEVKVMLKTDGEKIAGMVVVVTSDRELVFVNVSGDIDPEKTGLLISVIGEKYANGTLLPPALMQQLPGPHQQGMHHGALPVPPAPPAPASTDDGEADGGQHAAAGW